MPSRTIKHDAFISFASPDKKLAAALKKLCKSINCKAYFSDQDVKRSDIEMKKAIRTAIKSSRVLITIYSRYSLNRNWVMYETGIADALNVSRIPTRVASVTNQDIAKLPPDEYNILRLFNFEDLAEVLIKILKKRGASGSKAALTVKKEISPDDPLIKEVLSLAGMRRVFIAGNIPHGIENTNAKSGGKSNSYKQYVKKLEEFCENVTFELYDSGFSVSSCPQVDSVGEVVTNASNDWLTDNAKTASADFKIGGIYPIDNVSSETEYSDEAIKSWKALVRNFRKSYLIDMEWLLLIGGNQGTKDEYDVARELGIKTIAIPCFGGTAQEIYDSDLDVRIDQCRRCKTRKKAPTLKTIPVCINDIIKHFVE